MHTAPSSHGLCLETSNLSYSFSQNQPVLDKVDLQVSPGSIYGFLGPNGAGKTTTLRIALGLLRKQEGSVSFFGKSFDKNRINILKQVGTLIESPSLYGHLTATENLSVHQRIHQCPTARIQDVLNTVGLSDTGKKHAGQFSLGMKQRLSIAIALLHQPSLLILDEPTNGLDPNGIIEIRELLKQLNRENGITVVISSHLLSEIEKLVTHVGIINKGRMMFQGTLEELKNKQQQSLSVVFETSDVARTIQVMTHHHLAPQIENEKIVLPAISKEKIAALNQQLVNQGVEVFGISIHKSDLESIFIDLINN
jgi:ABC-type multidrug transport system ATPase subunit